MAPCAESIWKLPDAWEKAELLGALKEIVAAGGVEPLLRPPVDYLHAEGTGELRVQSLVRAALDQIGFEGVVLDIDTDDVAPKANSDLELGVVACLAAASFWRSRHGLLRADPVLEERMCVVTAVYLGLGIFVANGAYIVRPEQREQIATGPLPPGHVCYLLAVRSAAGRTPYRCRGEGLWIREFLNPVQQDFHLQVTSDLLDEAPPLREILGIPEQAPRVAAMAAVPQVVPGPRRFRILPTIEGPALGTHRDWWAVAFVLLCGIAGVLACRRGWSVESIFPFLLSGVFTVAWFVRRRASLRVSIISHPLLVERSTR